MDYTVALSINALTENCSEALFEQRRTERLRLIYAPTNLNPNPNFKVKKSLCCTGNMANNSVE